MKKAVFYHAGCSICVDAERMLLQYLNKDEVEVDIVHLGEKRGRIAEAEKAGISSVPALVIDELVYHINYGASLEDVKKG